MIKRLRCDDSLWAPMIATTINILLLYVVNFICRVEFYFHNSELFPGVASFGDFMNIAMAGTRFDTPGIFYVNALYILMMLFPLHYKERPGYYRVCKWVYVVLNSLSILANLADSIYFPYTMRRSTWDLTQEFAHESNTISVVSTEMWRNIPILLLAALLIFILIKCYVSPISVEKNSGERDQTSIAEGGEGREASSGSRGYMWRYYAVMTASLAIAAAICVGGIRGGWLNHWWYYLIALPLIYVGWRLRCRSRIFATVSAAAGLVLLCMAPIGGWRHRDIRPIALSNANAYAQHPSDVALILNTPFSFIRTFNDNPFPIPDYFADEAQMASIYTPDHAPLKSGDDGKPALTMDKRNVVVIILESFGEEYIDALNDRALGKNSPGYAPFMDSLVGKSVHFRYTYDNGNKSIDAMPSILGSIPKFGKSYILTSAAMYPIPGLPALLKGKGYATAFFHGARTGSMGFDGFARSIGFTEYFGREDFEADKRFGGKKEFDGYWAIWDEPFFQYYAAKMNEMQEPFMTAIFSATSHHPFQVPEKYEGKFPEGTLPIHKTIGYTDKALQEFFATASKSEWYKNTLFVITNDHTNQKAYDEYRSDISAFYGPVLLFDPSGEILQPGMREGIMSQLDVMPTVLGLLGYPDGYVAYGNDMSKSAVGITEEAMPGSAVSYINNIYQYVAEGYILQFDGEKSIGLYAITDNRMQRNLLREHPEEVDRLEKRLKALIQTFMMRNHARVKH